MTLKKDEIAEAVKDPKWQTFRQGLKGLPTEEKLTQLEHWRATNGGTDRKTEVQIENYRNALKRGGLLGKK